MANKAKGRHAQGAKPQGVAKGGPFRMVVAASPSSSLSISSELELLKAALLYGDKVTVLSPVTTTFLRAQGLQGFSPQQLVELLRRVAPTLGYAERITDYKTLLRSTPGGSVQLLQKLSSARRELSEEVRQLADNAGIGELDRARTQGLIEIESVDPGDAIDLLASCIISAKLTESGQRNNDSQTDRVIETFVDKLSKYLASGRDYLMFDKPTAELTEAAVREGIFIPAKGPAGRCAQAMTASGLMSQLPTFPRASVDDILDIRTELAPSLVQFRGAIVKVSKAIGSAPWETDFEDGMLDEWVGTVLPAVEAIKASVADNSGLSSLATNIAGATNKAYPGLAILAPALLAHHPSVAAAGAVIGGAVPFMEVIRNRIKTGKEIRMQPFYFLYKTDELLRK